MSKCKQCERLRELQSYIKEDLVPHTQIYIEQLNQLKLENEHLSEKEKEVRHYLEEAQKFKNCLTEIKEIAECCQTPANCKDYCQFYNECIDGGLPLILQKISKVLKNE